MEHLRKFTFRDFGQVLDLGKTLVEDRRVSPNPETLG